MIFVLDCQKWRYSKIIYMVSLVLFWFLAIIYDTNHNKTGTISPKASIIESRILECTHWHNTLNKNEKEHFVMRVSIDLDIILENGDPYYP